MLFAQATTPISAYQLFIDLTNTAEGVQVVLYVPTIEAKRVYFVLPIAENAAIRSLPLSRRLSQFRAYDREGKTLPYEIGDDHTILIEQAQRLHAIEYQWHDYTTADPHRYCIVNRNGYLGYIEGYRHLPYQINVKHPKDLRNLSGGIDQNPTDTLDQFWLSSYNEVVQTQKIYGTADTTNFVHGDTRYHIAVVSESGKLTARQLRYPVQIVVETAAPYIQKYLPPNYYLVFSFDNIDHRYAQQHQTTMYGGYADREASFYTLPEMLDARDLYDVVQPQVMHELLHSICPHHLHSRDAEFNGIAQRGVGQHLWLYEGVTEYLTQVLLLRCGARSETDFWSDMSRRIEKAAKGKLPALTQLSEQVYSRYGYKAQAATYTYGVVAAFYLDICLQQSYLRSNLPVPQYPPNLWVLLSQLIDRYGGEPFDDKTLFADIAQLTDPEVSDFISRYIADNQILPHQKMALLMGMYYSEKLVEPAATFGDFRLLPDYKKEQLIFSTPTNGDTRHQCLLPFKRGDRLLTLNGDTITTANINQYLHLLHDPKPDTPLSFTVLRQTETLSLSAMPRTYRRIYTHAFRPFAQTDDFTTKLKKNVLK